MCTVSWLRTGDGYHLLCNRDERHTRALASPPRLTSREGVRFLAPADGDHGGTWISVNELGVCVCLLNGERTNAEAKAAEQTSRGLLVMDLADSRTIGEAGERVAAMDLSVFAPFTLVTLEPGNPATVVEWDGRQGRVRTDADAFVPLVSSSFDSAGVRERRHAEFQNRLRSAGRLDTALLYSFHESHLGGAPSAYSPCMHRSDAQTVSFSWIKVGADEIEFFYSPAAPCQWAAGQSHTLRRRQVTLAAS